jgi:cyclophilin family peptidyl-prolyl cis-trans isomerase
MLARIFIREYYEEIPAEIFSEGAPELFREFCERIKLAKKYVDRYFHRYIPHPVIWFNKRNEKGFAGTKSWYDANERRKQEKFEKNIVLVRVYDPALENYQFTT